MTASEIFESVRARVRTGELVAGNSLPPVRELATQLDVHRNTVASAYKKLVAAGIVETNGRYGTTVKQVHEHTEQEGAVRQSTLTDVSGGNPDPCALPDLKTLLSAVSLQPRSYGDPVINPGLEKAGRDWFSHDVPDAFGLNVTHGAIDAIERLVSGYLAAGEKIVVEDPCFLSSINAIRGLGYVPAGVPVDRHGLLPHSLQEELEAGAQVVIITPRAHNPTGCSLSRQRAEEIQSVLARFPHVMVIVDDHFSLLSGRDYYNVIATETRNWAVIRSLSKFLGPDMRVALTASNAETSARLSQRLTSGMNWVSHMLQDMAEMALTSDAIRRKISQAAVDYHNRRERLLTALSQHGVAVNGDCDGLNVWLPLISDPSVLLHTLEQQGWLVRPGNRFYVAQPEHSIRLTPAALSDSQLMTLAADLSAALHTSGNKICAA